MNVAENKSKLKVSAITADILRFSDALVHGARFIT